MLNVAQLMQRACPKCGATWNLIQFETCPRCLVDRQHTLFTKLLMERKTCPGAALRKPSVKLS
mgnify:CR=1 FL=1